MADRETVSEPGAPIDILLVEDNAGDVRLVREGLACWTRQARLAVAEDGEAALQLLRGQAANGTNPDLVILDLNMPRKDGYEFLRDMRATPGLRMVRVVVLTSSTDEDLLRQRGLEVDGYVVKAVRVEDFVRAVCSIEDVLASSDSRSSAAGRQDAMS